MMELSRDPDRAEILAFLDGAGFADGGLWDASDFDREEALYWFAYAYHGGGGSALYSALCTSSYRPGPITDGPEPDSVSQLAYEALTAHWKDVADGKA